MTWFVEAWFVGGVEVEFAEHRLYAFQEELVNLFVFDAGDDQFQRERLQHQVSPYLTMVALNVPDAGSASVVP